MCLTPQILNRPKEDWIQGLPETRTRIVPCGKCPQCYRKRQRDWSIRLSEEQKQADTACFLTLTYEEPPITNNGYATLRKRDFQLFMKKLRKKTNGKLKYYSVGEYGSRTNRPHYHGIMFNFPKSWMENPSLVNQTWNRGHIMVGSVTPGSISYVTKYVMSGTWKPQHDGDDRESQFSLMSKGLGRGYLTDRKIRYHKENLIGHYTRPGGDTATLPRYFKDILFEKWEKQIIAMTQQKFAVEMAEQFLTTKDEIKWKKDQFRKAEKNLKKITTF